MRRTHTREPQGKENSYYRLLCKFKASWIFKNTYPIFFFEGFSSYRYLKSHIPRRQILSIQLRAGGGDATDPAAVKYVF
jgi:hypothetical protein